tara:strand:+ start:3715 stop:4983 length:1269 start_codon:yes stop_codon:yes gene_type:complete
MSTKFKEIFFCPAPWNNVFYSNNNPAPCTIIRQSQEMTTEEWHNSELLKSIKTDLLQGKVPSTCTECKLKEDLGLKSMRASMWGWDNLSQEPIYENMSWYGKLNIDTPQNPRRIEVRFSNLCNMKCRHCDELSSSLWAKEKIEHQHDIDSIEFRSQGHKDLYFSKESDGIIKPVNSVVESIFNLAKNASNLEKISFTGGEPFLIKEYYNFLDLLIKNKINENIDIELFTNCSVLNPKFTKRLEKFPKVIFNMSVDGVGKTAEYIRHKTDWNTVEKNILHFNSLGGVFSPCVNIAISSYTLLDMSNFATFLMKLYEDNNDISTKGYYCHGPEVANFRNLPQHLRLKAIDEIDKAIEIIIVPNYDSLINELSRIKFILQTEEAKYPDHFIKRTRYLDSIRNEKFEDVFRINLEPEINPATITME